MKIGAVELRALEVALLQIAPGEIARDAIPAGAGEEGIDVRGPDRRGPRRRDAGEHNGRKPISSGPLSIHSLPACARETIATGIGRSTGHSPLLHLESRRPAIRADRRTGLGPIVRYAVRCSQRRPKNNRATGRRSKHIFDHPGENA